MKQTYPYNLEAEKALLGGIMLDNEQLGALEARIAPEDFYREPHRKIYAAMLELRRRGAPIDLVTLREQLEAMAQLKEVGHLVYLSSLVDLVPVTTNLGQYAQIVREKATLRRVLELGADLQEAALQSSAAPEELLERAERGIYELMSVRQHQEYSPISVLVEQAMEELERRSQLTDPFTGVPTGLTLLDRLTSGLQDGDLIILAARPSMGKTALALDFTRTAAMRGYPVAIFSLEMSKLQLTQRLIGSQALINGEHLRSGSLDEREWQRWIKAAEEVHGWPVYIDDTPALSVSELRSKARRLRQQKKIRLLIVDYLQLMSGGSKVELREQEISQISRNLKALAKELGIPVLALSQLNRGLEQRGDKRPMMSDLRESGAIEQDADLIMFIYREWVYKRRNPGFEDDDELRRRAEVLLEKQRNGSTGTVQCVFLEEYSTFRNVAAVGP